MFFKEVWNLFKNIFSSYCSLQRFAKQPRVYILIVDMYGIKKLT
jgi:hypothetical protein